MELGATAKDLVHSFSRTPTRSMLTIVLYLMHKRVAHLPYFWNSQSLLSAHSRKSVRRSEKI